MNHKNANWTEKEEPDEVNVYSSSVKMKQDLDEDVNQEFVEDPLMTENPSLKIKQDPDLKHNVSGSGHDNSMNVHLSTILEAKRECYKPLPLYTLVPKKELLLGDPLGISWPTDYIKEDPKLNSEVDETENIVLPEHTSPSALTKSSKLMPGFAVFYRIFHCVLK
ncbi:uncharacterized protein LOC126426646 [Schistocerca serialis cubense]|uniref:uncharacterized protein LOC126426646 n=1 Tax=Schistocerca serialis cubense TaxID=2023355 RepID=UPI00214EEE1E|nr:uncharacterized protein LOC126426646 [Schistocerca serialis cubense]